MESSLFFIFNSIFFFILGAAIGSFLNVLADRLPNEESINGRSHCDKCKHVLGVLDLFPILSFIALQGKCRYCKTKLSFFYPLVEIFTGLAFLGTYLWFILTSHYNPGIPLSLQSLLMLLLYLPIISCLIAIFFADLKYHIIPDSLQIVLFILSFVFLLVKNSVVPFQSILIEALFSAVIVLLPLLLLFIVTKGRGMGFGDVKLAFTIGFLFGIKAGLLVLYIAFVSGAVVGVILILLKKKKMKSAIAFGPFLILGMIIMLFFGLDIMSWLHQFFFFI